MRSRYKPIIGLEVHVELRTASKMFCSCPAEHFGKSPNTQVCPVCLGLPGALPVPNKKAIEWTQMLGAALGCTLAQTSHFDRKHYFYPDLPKGYQISQYNEPLCRNGVLEIKSEIQNPKSETNSKSKIQNSKKIGIHRVHLEEDTGKLFHTVVDGKRVSLIDFNRSGVALVEVVTEPDFSSAEEAREFAQELQQIVRHLSISDADMEKGSMRIEANISLANELQVTSHELPDYRVEVKNINSFRFLEQAINNEIKRQEEVLEAGSRLTQETRGFDEKSGTTKVQRWKEEAQDYRYFPEPDIPPFSFTDAQLEETKRQLPELPASKRKRFEKEYKLPPHYANILTQTRSLADYFEEAVKVGREHSIQAKKVADVIVNKKLDIEKILPAKLIEMLRETKERPVLLSEELEQAVTEVINENPKPVADYKKGKKSSLQFLIGQVMKKTKGQTDPNAAKNLLLLTLEKKPLKR